MDDGPFEEEAFDIWIDQDPRHRTAFDGMWRRIMGPGMGAALHDYDRRMKGRRTAVASVAAILIMAAGGYKAMPLIEMQMAHAHQFAAADGTVREVVLEDGTRLTLGAGTNVTVRYTRHDRVIELGQGALFANVHHDEDRPFRIETDDAEIVDKGTSFEVVSKAAHVRVTVAAGIVDFSKRGWFQEPTRLAANQVAVLDRNGVNRSADVQPGDVAPWRGEWVEYKAKPLKDVVDDLRSLSPAPIEFAREELGAQPVSGRIRLTDPMGQLENLSVIQGFNIERVDDRIIIY